MAYSVFIPRVFSNISTDRISRIFRYYKIGEVKKVNLVKKTNLTDGKSYNIAFVHFAGLYDTPEADAFRRDVEDPNVKAKFVYDNPWHWIVLPFEKKDNHRDSNPDEFQPQPQFKPQPQPQPQLTQFCVMTPQGPMWQWGFPAPTASLIPPQVMYGKTKHKSRTNKPRMRINVPTKKEEGEVEEGEVEEGEVEEGDVEV